MAGTNPPWTEERKALVTKLWLDGKSASECAAILGEGATRNSVIGQVTRMKLAKHGPTAVKKARLRTMEVNGTADAVKASKRRRPQPAPRENTAAVTRIDRRRDAKLPTPNRLAQLADDAPAPIAVRGRAWEALAGTSPKPLGLHHEGECRWPIGDPLEAGFAFCCAPVQVVKEKERPYCQPHEQLFKRIV